MNEERCVHLQIQEYCDDCQAELEQEAEIQRNYQLEKEIWEGGEDQNASDMPEGTESDLMVSLGEQKIELAANGSAVIVQLQGVTAKEAVEIALVAWLQVAGPARATIGFEGGGQSGMFELSEERDGDA